ncbi:MAG: ABC transporter permease [Pyrinomonadaceae bacterium]|nr:ABC transporter permease [Pyrinomonadaceae bacterium]MCX7640154.1 ABC transporter permease [Pyrinomonadaceae bacterium]MDW8303258.1 FtsX-like permease family protein [Acidobacteriota bacterium]
MLDLILANLKSRPFRTAVSILGVTIGVTLILLFSGLAVGISNDMARRAANWKAEIVFTRPGAMELTSSSPSLSTTYVKKLQEIEGVHSVVPVIRYVSPNLKARWGFQQIDGVDWKPFAEMNEMQIVAGRPPEKADEVILDERQMKKENKQIGDLIELFGGRTYKIVGVFAPPSGARIKMSLSAMQEALEAPNKCTYILVKIKDGETPEQVATRINQALPGNKINLTRDLVIDAQDRVPGLNAFLKVLIGLGAFVSAIFVLLSMYTTITERRREIGILKSLGASKSFIISTIESEALLIGAIGVLIGLITSFFIAYLIQKNLELVVEFTTGWVLTATFIALTGSLLGAFYPAWKASKIDPVKVMTNE